MLQVHLSELREERLREQGCLVYYYYLYYPVACFSLEMDWFRNWRIQILEYSKQE